LLTKKKPITCYTDHQIFERYHKFNIKTAIRKTEYHFKRTDDTFGWDYATLITELDVLEGCKKIQVEGKTQNKSSSFYAD
jgi:transcription-repair coupling factor (superfamily II helicase)